MSQHRLLVRSLSIFCPEPLPLFILLGLFATGMASAQSDDMAFAEYEESGDYVLTFYDRRPATLAWFRERGLEGGGYTWESMATLSLALEPPSPVYDPNFDPTPELFIAYLPSAAARSDLRARLARLASDTAFRESAIASVGLHAIVE